MRFFDTFENREELIRWMKDRPKGVANIHEVDGDKDIVVVIPTADFNGNYAKECREKIFKGLHIVFVESGDRDDFYFNIAHNINVGIQKAMEYNPKWIVFSGDDMHKIDEVTKLRGELNKLDHNKVGIAYPFPSSNYYSINESLSRIRITRFILASLSSRANTKNFFNIKRKFDVRYVIQGKSFLSKIFYKEIIPFKDTISLAIFNSLMLENFYNEVGYYYDETYINCHEESDLAIRFSRSSWEPANIQYRILPIVGGTLGTSKMRLIRDQCSGVYLSHKFEKQMQRDQNKEE